jgi:glycosyltransferase involved in cell wall biosynthesis
MPDIVGNGGLLVDATNVDSLTRSIICVLTNRDYTKKLALRGKKRSKLFSWVKLAKETVCCYESLQK